MTLKGICISLVRKSATLDSVALFCPPQTLLQPLCNLLDGWEGHEDQGIRDICEYALDVVDRSQSRISPFMRNLEAFFCWYRRSNTGSNFSLRR